MRIAIVMPVVLQNETLLGLTLDAAAHLTTQYSATLYVVSNRLHVCAPDELKAAIERRFYGAVEVLHEPGVERSVAGAWNHGCALATKGGVDYLALIANDTVLRDDCLDILVAFGEKNRADLWSGISSNNRGEIDRLQVTDGADFSCFMIRPNTIEQHGLFDPNFRPAYFEDNDYYGRVVLGGGECRVVHAAQFHHHGSMTVRHDGEMAYHVSYWFDKNRDYFRRKWGVSQPENSSEGVLRRYYRHPFNDLTRPLNWFPPENA
jgi:GT2 family glycosyltransferase